MPGSSQMSSYVKISGLLRASIVAFYPTWILMTYLTNVWKLDLTHAAAIINVFTGASLILPLFMSVLVDAYIGQFYMLALSGVAYSFGLSFLAMSTPPVLSKLVGNCSAYEPECIGGTQKALFYTAILLMSIGAGGYTNTLNSFMEIHAQQASQYYIETEKALECTSFLRAAVLVAYALLPLQPPWAILFGIPAICTVLATIIFFTGSFGYVETPPIERSVLTMMSRVLVASASKLYHCKPTNVNELYGSSSPDRLAHTPRLSFLDKAAIILPNKTLEQQKMNRWKLCTVTEVEITKTVIRLLPTITAYFTIGIICTIQHTFFLEQATHMKPNVRWFNSLPICLAFHKVGMLVAAGLYDFITMGIMDESVRNYIPTTGFLMAMIASIPCCLTAALVEKTRLDRVMLKHDVDETTIPMSILWLLPQFFLVGAVDKLLIAGGKSYFEAAEIPDSSVPFLQKFAAAVHGLGHIGSVLFVHSLGKVSQSGNQSSWFQETLNQSRLDNYYWTLAVICIFIMVSYILSLRCKFKSSNPTTRRPGETFRWTMHGGHKD